MQENELNWIGGRWRGAESGHTYVLPLEGGDPEAQREFPRSGLEDLGMALEAAGGVERAWRALPSAVRAGALGGMLEELSRGGRAGTSSETSVARALGLSERAITHDRRLARRAGERLLLDETPDTARPGPSLARARAGELFTGVLARILPPLAAGRAVVLLSDPELPHIACELARVAEASTLPQGVLSVLHDDGETLLRAALGHPAFGEWRLSGSGSELARFRRQAEGAPRHAPSSLRGAPFGAGVVDLGPPALMLELVRNKSRVVHEHESPEEAAEGVARAAFGRHEALSGQRAGHVGRVFCHELLFSEFSACLIEAVEELHAQQEPVPLFDPELPAVLESRVRLGLDEGATLVLGASLGLSGSRRSRRDATLEPTVFTNAEPRMRLVRATRPAPVLCLLRTAGDEEGEALAASVDELPDDSE